MPRRHHRRSAATLRHIPSDVLAIVCSFLPWSMNERLLSLTHVCHDVTANLSPLCFRGHLLMRDGLINALPSLSPRTFTFLVSATSLSIEFGHDAYFEHREVLFTDGSDRSLLHFHSITSLFLCRLPRLERLNERVRTETTPLSFFHSLLSSTDRPVLPHLTTLTIEAVSVAENWLSSFPFHLFPSLTTLTLSALIFFNARHVYDWLSLPALQRLDLRWCVWMSTEGVAECKRRCEEMAEERGVELLWSWIQR